MFEEQIAPACQNKSELTVSDPRVKWLYRTQERIDCIGHKSEMTVSNTRAKMTIEHKSEITVSDTRAK